MTRTQGKIIGCSLCQCLYTAVSIQYTTMTCVCQMVSMYYAPLGSALTYILYDATARLHNDTQDTFSFKPITLVSTVTHQLHTVYKPNTFHTCRVNAFDSACKCVHKRNVLYLVSDGYRTLCTVLPQARLKQ